MSVRHVVVRPRRAISSEPPDPAIRHSNWTQQLDTDTDTDTDTTIRHRHNQTQPSDTTIREKNIIYIKIKVLIQGGGGREVEQRGKSGRHLILSDVVDYRGNVDWATQDHTRSHKQGIDLRLFYFIVKYIKLT